MNWAAADVIRREEELKARLKAKIAAELKAEAEAEQIAAAQSEE